MTAVIL